MELKLLSIFTGVEALTKYLVLPGARVTLAMPTAILSRSADYQSGSFKKFDLEYNMNRMSVRCRQVNVQESLRRLLGP